MKYQKSFILFTFIIIAIFATSCNKELEEPQPINETTISFLGKKLKNPYSVENMQDWDSNESHTYTPLFIDAIDNYNQHNEDSNRPDDRIRLYSNYSTGSFELFVVKNTYGLSSLRTNLKNSSTIIGTNTEVDIYMDYFNGY